MHGLIKVDGIEALELIAVVREQVSGILKKGTFWVGDEVAGVELADVRGHVVKGLTGTRAADHEDV